MSTEHSKAAKKFLQNQQYAHWHDAQLREKASAIKCHTITHLDEYLDQFATNAEKNGVEVHWAKDAEEFNAIVYDILRNHRVKKIVKSKSMLTEECEMNPYLEARGIEVVETDLGERIIQLKGQKPSHIVMPAIHLNHDDVGELFEEKGISKEKGNHDPTYLTYMARLSLRNEFLTADAGMTGANFGIAETGDIVVCTNEGNADMSTSCPRLHIAAIGLEKIIPNYECLAVFQRMLCRAGTGQPTTTYTSHFRKARPTLGGAEVHPLWLMHEHLSCISTLWRLFLQLLHSWPHRHQFRYVERQASPQRQCIGLHALPKLPDGVSCQGEPRRPNLPMAPTVG